MQIIEPFRVSDPRPFHADPDLDPGFLKQMQIRMQWRIQSLNFRSEKTTKQINVV